MNKLSNYTRLGRYLNAGWVKSDMIDAVDSIMLNDEAITKSGVRSFTIEFSSKIREVSVRSIRSGYLTVTAWLDFGLSKDFDFDLIQGEALVIK